MCLEISQNSQCQSLFLNKEQFLRTPFLRNTSRRLLLWETEQYLVWHLFIIQKQTFRIILQIYYSAIPHRYFSWVMVKRSTLQLYKTSIFLAQLWMAASNHLINKCNQKIRQVKNQIIKHQIWRKIKATRLVKFLSCFFKWLECVVLGELQVPNALQHRFKIFSGTT